MHVTTINTKGDECGNEEVSILTRTLMPFLSSDTRIRAIVRRVRTVVARQERRNAGRFFFHNRGAAIVSLRHFLASHLPLRGNATILRDSAGGTPSRSIWRSRGAESRSHGTRYPERVRSR